MTFLNLLTVGALAAPAVRPAASPASAEALRPADAAVSAYMHDLAGAGDASHRHAVRPDSELHPADGPDVQRVPHGLPAAHPVRPPLQAQRLHDGCAADGPAPGQRAGALPAPGPDPPGLGDGDLVHDVGEPRRPGRAEPLDGVPPGARGVLRRGHHPEARHLPPAHVRSGRGEHRHRQRRHPLRQPWEDRAARTSCTA